MQKIGDKTAFTFYHLQTASLKDTLEMKESSSPVDKRSSTGSVKGKVGSCFEAAVS